MARERSSASATSNTASMRRDCGPAACTTSSARAKTPGWLGTSSKPKLDSQWNQRDQFISIRFPLQGTVKQHRPARRCAYKALKFTAIIVSGATSDAELFECL